MEERKNWLASLKEGDQVFVSGNYGESIKKIDRITPTRLMKIGNVRFKDGSQIGDSCWKYSIYPVTQEVVNKMHKRDLVFKLKRIRYEDISLEILEKIESILKEDKQCVITGYTS